MNFFAAIVVCLVALQSVYCATINRDLVQPFAQPGPVTISEKAAIKFKPQLFILDGCVSFPAVNADGDTTGGLNGTQGGEGCSKAPLGSQVYGRSTWYQDKWAMMFAWYIPKSYMAAITSRRHDWASMVVWIENPSLEIPEILGVSLSNSANGYLRYTGYISDRSFSGHVVSSRRRDPDIPGSSTSLRVEHTVRKDFRSAFLDLAQTDGDYQDLIMWGQLTEEARMALNTTDFGRSKVPFNDDNFLIKLRQAYPF
ncbi:hypothetical protein F441_21168 [Phytophthora nicotianae CJ01A1]|uniref:Uncharacterized protein n=3 Tax=Phytophthora nicotianae TaxID=4792 RepID=V9DY52_PHYNI|nr:hypothetical protein F443_21269 [Phytophthora nicotianae P1569]ETL78846.1 hypothetical protein L917_20416 [Phytophthora nicotianae]ETP01616.1 hypothetical protein F441_21168 [Phytophthora nicotianae CJ01A1]